MGKQTNLVGIPWFPAVHPGWTTVSRPARTPHYTCTFVESRDQNTIGPLWLSHNSVEPEKTMNIVKILKI